MFYTDEQLSMILGAAECGQYFIVAYKDMSFYRIFWDNFDWLENIGLGGFDSADKVLKYLERYNLA